MDVRGFQIKHLVGEVLQKTTFHRSWDSVDFGAIFQCFLLAMETILVTFWWLGDKLEI